MTEAPNKRSIPWLQIALPIVVMIVIFGWLLPRVIDYSEVWDAITALTWNQFLLLASMGIVASFLEAGLYTVLIPRLGLFNGWKAFLGGNTIAGFAPNPFDIIVRFAMYQGFGVRAPEAGASIIIGGTTQSVFSVFAPILALAVFVFTGHGTDTLKIFVEVAVAAAIGVVVLVVVALRREAIAGWIGRLCQRTADWLLPRLNRESPDGIEDMFIGFRGLLVKAIATTWWKSMLFMTGSHVVKFSGMLYLFRVVGIPASEVSNLELLGIYTIGLLVGLMPIVPSGVGATEFAYIWIIARDDEALADLVAAATFSHRIFFWLLPIAIGVIPLTRWMRGNREKLDTESGFDVRSIIDESDSEDQDSTGKASS